MFLNKYYLFYVCSNVNVWDSLRLFWVFDLGGVNFIIGTAFFVSLVNWAA